MEHSDLLAGTAKPGMFVTTHWSVVLAAGANSSPQSDAALAKLCETYWFPLYVYVRRRGNGPEDAEDLTQEYFSGLLKKNLVAIADRERGKFRTFLLSSMKNFLVNEWKRSERVKRGGGHSSIPFHLEEAEGRLHAAEPAVGAQPEMSYDRQWAVAIIDQVIARLRREYSAIGKQALLEELRPFVWGEESSTSYTEIARRLEMTEGNVKVSVHRLRQRFRELLRAEVGQTVSEAEDVDGELRYLIAVLA